MTTRQPGLIILLGSGETSTSIRKVYHWLFERLASKIQIGILETPAGFEPNSDRVASQIADFFKQRLQNFQPQTTIIPARKRGTPYSPDDPEIVTPLLKTNIIMMGPGSPTYTVRQLQDTVAWQTLNARHRLSATLIFASAATVAVSAQTLPVYEIYKVGEDLHWKSGLNFFADYGLSLIFIPHWNNNDGGTELDTSRCYIGQVRYAQLVEMLSTPYTIVGLDERTALVIDPTKAVCQVMGQGNVTVVCDGAESVFPSGKTFPLATLGPFRPLANPYVNIPIGIWKRVLDAQTEAYTQTAAPIPSSEVLTLLAKRDAARQQKDWANADRLRETIQALGWQILDTPEGSRLEPSSN